jgi:hypothetical protein
MDRSVRVWHVLQVRAVPWYQRYSTLKAMCMLSMHLVLTTHRMTEDMGKMEATETMETIRRVVGGGGCLSGIKLGLHAIVSKVVYQLYES